MGDRRTVKTRSAIKEAFLRLLERKSINNITVAEISELADIGRGTFYLHYRDIYDLYENIENEVFGQLGSFYDASFPSENHPVSLLAYIEQSTEYIYENKKIFALLINRANNTLTLQKLKELFKSKIVHIISIMSEGKVSEYDTVVTAFVISGVVGVLEEWIGTGMVKTPKQISEILHKVLLKLDF